MLTFSDDEFRRNIQVESGVKLNLIPVIAVALAILLLNERLRWAEIAGGALVIAAALAASRPREAPMQRQG